MKREKINMNAKISNNYKNFSCQFIDNDILCVTAEKVDNFDKLNIKKDNPLSVFAFFERWNAETVFYL